jgi:GNAT superfamily N-acetyltransferase
MATGKSAVVLDLTLVEVDADSVTAVSAEQVAELTRLAYVDSDPLPGLPPPDGATETADTVLGFLNGGGRIWAASTRGELIGVLRTTGAADGSMWMSRVGVTPAWRRNGVAEWLVTAVENFAAAAGIPAVRLDAVIERCVPPFYGRLGYHVVEHHVAIDDKLLTEVTMERDPAAPRRPVPPDLLALSDAAMAGAICWFITADGMAVTACPGCDDLAAAITHCAGEVADDDARLAGVDVWRGAPADLDAVVRQLSGVQPGPRAAILRFGGDRGSVPHHLMPRAHHLDLWAALRFVPGREPRPVFLVSPPSGA